LRRIAQQAKKAGRAPAFFAFLPNEFSLARAVSAETALKQQIRALRGLARDS
jgi:hypothetical protein